MPWMGIEKLYRKIIHTKNPVARFQSIAFGSGVLVFLLSLAALFFYQYRNYQTAVKIQNAFMEQYLGLVRNKLEDSEAKARGLRAILEVQNEQNAKARNFHIHIQSSAVWNELPDLLRLKNDVFSNLETGHINSGKQADEVKSESPLMSINHFNPEGDWQSPPSLELVLPLLNNTASHADSQNAGQHLLGMLHLGLNTEALQQTLELMEQTTKFAARLTFRDSRNETFELYSRGYSSPAASFISPTFPEARREIPVFGGTLELEIRPSAEVMQIGGFSPQAILSKILVCVMAGILSWLVLTYGFHRCFTRQRLSLLGKMEKINVDLKEQTQKLDASRRNSEDFIGILSHEIRNPLLALKQIQAELGNIQLPDDVQRLISIQESALATALDTLNNTLDLKKMELSALQLETINFEPLLLLDEIRNLLSVQCRNKRIALNINLDPAIPSTIKGDPLRLKQILLNLMCNAAKFTPPGGVIELAVSTAPAEPMQVKLKFQVRDSGKGIEPQMIDRLLEPYQQADSSIARQYGGTGLGLNIASRIIHLMGGKLAIDSKLDVGTAFNFELQFEQAGTGIEPAEQAVDADRDRRLSALQQEFDPNTMKLKLLYVDDNEFNLMVAEELTRKSGHQLFLFANPDDALAFINNFNGPVDIVLSDLNMPGLSGQEFADRVRTSRYGTEIFVAAITASPTAEVQPPALDMFNGVFSKPFNLKKILKRFEEWKTEERVNENAQVVDC